MKKETGNRLALVILTHYHADHMSGFASNYDDFASFDVGAVWITNRLDPGNADASKFMAQITSVAQQLKMQLAARNDPAAMEAHHKVENALGVASEDGGGGSNAKALRLLQSGFKNKPPVYYYQGGDTPTLPDELKGMITAELLGPSPKDSRRRIRRQRQQDRAISRCAWRQRRAGRHSGSNPLIRRSGLPPPATIPRTFDEFDSGFSNGAEAKARRHFES